MSAAVGQFKELNTTVGNLSRRLAIADLARKVAELEEQTGEAGFWGNPEAAQKVMQEIARLKDRIEPWQKLQARISDALELASLNDPELEGELDAEYADLQSVVDRMSIQALLSGPNDSRDAFLAIHAGAGGTDSQDWAQMLERMYLRWAEDNGYKVEVIERSEGEEAGIKSVTLGIRGNYAYGYLRSEQGVHRLVRLSPFDSASRRHTSFVKVELWPDIQDDIDIEINEKDLRIDTYRAGGAGGQHMQKNDTAVRITHLPTGIVIQCQNERSQAQNRDRAMMILRARLADLERQRHDAELAALKGENVNAEWGNQIRSYVLHPYQLVKDHRTNHETGNTTAVLDGRLNDFMEAFLHMKVDQANNGR
ncbi:MAG: peptide chain release factor 2 [Anaerolineae bacterium]|nr:MAG: peptide chain release factor 2 [Chloroflexi bacterium OLB13]MBC6955072.1 peptide chain release factor 2 [Chloroflexota bacterium]MBV6435675.1 Peptide chain release factor 2 [Anaerolineae bacterium]MDL1915209.1 peptide chain release factor 2 [Anaerolineae bacterium CFX4]MBW7880807.1 peptide chain release factor 2 [Anaerolineae bacterium]